MVAMQFKLVMSCPRRREPTLLLAALLLQAALPCSAVGVARPSECDAEVAPSAGTALLQAGGLQRRQRVAQGDDDLPAGAPELPASDPNADWVAVPRDLRHEVEAVSREFGAEVATDKLGRELDVLHRTKVVVNGAFQVQIPNRTQPTNGSSRWERSAVFPDGAVPPDNISKTVTRTGHLAPVAGGDGWHPLGNKVEAEVGTEAPKAPTSAPGDAAGDEFFAGEVFPDKEATLGSMRLKPGSAGWPMPEPVPSVNLTAGANRTQVPAPPLSSRRRRSSVLTTTAATTTRKTTVRTTPAPAAVARPRGTGPEPLHLPAD